MLKYEEIVNFIQKSCWMLDEEDFDGFLGLCSKDFQYKITAFSPEINKEMIWMDEDFEGLKSLLGMVPEHLRRLGKFTRHVSIGQTSRKDHEVSINSTFIVIHTDLDGKSNIFGVGRYNDKITYTINDVFLLSRNAYLETRDLGIGSHVPI
ncbi:MAG: 2-aminobenzenesulfonate 2,3-dioxygenase subunit beta [Alphaproteobacteria bacterium MarineAlpha2_Bin1]|nr:MAG: 2-aminobenzenesulfonate 2,3-dioxygenase subunit beta [Alphaproteobacteria bacterium MarineAlpha2_Bin1]